MLRGELRPPPHERADRGRRRVQDVHAVLLDDRPPAVLVWPIRRAFVEHAGRVVRERSVDDVAVARDPPAVGRAPIHVVVVDVEDQPVRGRDLRHVAAGRVRDALGLAGRAARVQQVEEVLRVHRLRRAVRGLLRDQLVVPVVASLRERMLVAASTDGDHVLDARAFRDGGVGVVLERDDRASTPGTVGGDEHLGLGVVDAVAKRLGAEPTEDDGMRRADPRAGEHRDRQLGDHPQVDVHPVALGDPEAAERVRQAGDLVEQVAIRERAGVAGLALPVEGDLVPAAGLDVTVEAVHGGVQLPSGEPGHPRGLPVHQAVPRADPGELLRLLRPERLVVGVGRVVERPVGHEGPFTEGCGRFEHSILGQQGFDVAFDVAHGPVPFASAGTRMVRGGPYGRDPAVPNVART